MPRTPARITQADIARALRAVVAAGVRARVEVAPDGTIVIIPMEPGEGRRESTGQPPAALDDGPGRPLC